MWLGPQIFPPPALVPPRNVKCPRCGTPLPPIPSGKECPKCGAPIRSPD